VELLHWKLNNAKAIFYNEIDRNPLFKGAAAVEDRSNMNATFIKWCCTRNFDAMWKAGISGIPGHRSVGVTELLCTMHYQ
jgi:phosphoserine aminotransferase